MALENISDILSYSAKYSDNYHQHIQMIIEFQVLPKIIKLLSDSKERVIKSAIKTLTHMAGGSNEQKKILLNFNIITSISSLCICEHENREIQDGTIVCSPTMQKRAMSLIGILLRGANKYLLEQLIQSSVILVFSKFATCHQVDLSDVSTSVITKTSNL